MNRNNFIFACACFIAIPLSNSAQVTGKSNYIYDKSGNVRSVLFSATDREFKHIKSSDVFFREVLKVKDNNKFAKNMSIRLDDRNETFDQFYEGIRVEDAGYTFHYDENGNMRYAHGNYVDISEFDTRPAISMEDASRAFAIFKGLSPDSITHSSAELIIKNVEGGLSDAIPLLVYKVTIEVSFVCVTEYGYVDAKTGNVVETESYIHHSTATGTFVTKYYGTKYATTSYNNSYYLYDSTRGNGIETKDLQNLGTFIPNYALYAQTITNSNNYWQYNNYTDSLFMAFDVYWALQKIYDRLYNVHGKNSLDNNGKKIMSYVRTVFATNYGGTTTNNASWNDYSKEFYFGIGNSYNRPFSTLDVVAHEYGHGIASYQIGWSSNIGFLGEGLSDIWGAIMDYRFGGTNAEVWKIGEHLPPSHTCLRDIESPTSTNAESVMADTYNSLLYNYFEDEYDFYGMSGVFSHWFYLLVNGGHGYNSNGIYYVVDPIGMDVAESLIVKAVYDNFLRYTSTYDEVRNAFVAAASLMNINGLEAAVRNAWYAVGVGDTGMFITGPAYTGDESLPSGCSVVWSLSNSYYNQYCLEQDEPSENECTISCSSSQIMMNDTLMATIMYNSAAIKTLTKTGVYAYDDIKGHYTSGNISSDISYTHILPVMPNYNTIIISPMLIGATVSYSTTATTPLYWGFSPYSGEIDVTMPANSNGIPIVINIVDLFANQYTLYLFAQNSYSMNIFCEDNSITVMQNKDDDSDSGLYFNQPWTVEVRNATTGALTATRSSTSRSATIITVGWPKGIYIVKVTVGKEILTEKVIVR